MSSKNQYFSVEKHGPAIHIKVDNKMESSYFEADLTYGFKCNEWPKESDWLQRCRKWPSKKDVKEIVEQGIHIVPKSQSNDNKELTWRYSFSYPELELSKKINEVARKCFLALKIIGKDFLMPTCQKVKSYHLKTIFYFHVERIEPTYWRENQIEECFQSLFSEVMGAFRERRCLHFWLTSINLFDRLTVSDAEKLLEVCRKIKEKPTRYIEQLFIKRDQSYHV